MHGREIKSEIILYLFRTDSPLHAYCWPCAERNGNVNPSNANTINPRQSSTEYLFYISYIYFLLGGKYFSDLGSLRAELADIQIEVEQARLMVLYGM